jgi:hypothetical protein
MAYTIKVNGIDHSIDCRGRPAMRLLPIRNAWPRLRCWQSSMIEIAIFPRSKMTITIKDGGGIATWNERQAKRMPMRFSPTIAAAIAACQANDAVSLAKDHYWSARR